MNISEEWVHISSTALASINDDANGTSPSHYYDRVANTLAIVYSFILGITGLIGNTLILIVMIKTKPTTATSVYLASLAVLDISALISEFLVIYQAATKY